MFIVQQFLKLAIVKNQQIIEKSHLKKFLKIELKKTIFFEYSKTLHYLK